MIDKLSSILTDVKFIPGDRFCWSPKEQTISYLPDNTEEDGSWALLHESGHAALNHLVYTTDYELLRMEIEAWEKAKEIANKLNIQISEEHIQDCLDSYRDWLYSRSICPKCKVKTLQNDHQNVYSCFNCHACWQVSPSRFCRSYRSLKENDQVILI